MSNLNLKIPQLKNVSNINFETVETQENFQLPSLNFESLSGRTEEKFGLNSINVDANINQVHTKSEERKNLDLSQNVVMPDVNVNIEETTIPSIELGDLSETKVSEVRFKVPEMKFPDVEVQQQDTKIPSFNMPKLDNQISDVNFPKL